MKTSEIKIWDNFDILCKALSVGGAFLVVQGSDGKPNAMTIGWATLGVIWGQPMMTVLVRPSRHTFSLLENNKHFSVCVPDSGMAKELAVCGSKSGRDTDKFKECRFARIAGKTPGITVISDCGVFYECETVQKTRIIESELDAAIKTQFYPKGDFHSVYMGKVLAAYRKL